jgi:predicted ATPase
MMSKLATDRELQFINHIKVDNFKSLVDFEMPLAGFNCLVGLNGVGKSTVLQFFDFLAQQVRGDLAGWLERRQWQSGDLHSQLTRKQNITFEITWQHRAGFEVKWSASFNPQALRCTSERVEWNRRVLLEVENGAYDLWTLGQAQGETIDLQKREHVLAGKIAFNDRGSIISQLQECQLPKEMLSLKWFLNNLQDLDILVPKLLEERSGFSNNSLGLGEAKILKFMAEMDDAQRLTIQEKLANIYPQFQQFDVAALRAGYSNLTVEERFGEAIVRTESPHIASGLLRMLAVLTQLAQVQSFLLMDGIENSFNPQLIEFIVDEVVASSPQVLITTHSPMVLNYLEDEVAIEGVIYIYKNQIGATQAIRLFDLPRMRQKLTVMGAGEVYEDTLLTRLNAEILGGL